MNFKKIIIKFYSVKVILLPFKVGRIFSFRRPERNYSAIHKGIEEELNYTVILQFLYEVHYNFLPGTKTGGYVPTLNGRKITFTEAIRINFF